MKHKWQLLIPQTYPDGRQTNRQGCIRCGAIQHHDKHWKPNAGECIAPGVTEYAINKWTTKDERKKALVMLAWSNARKQGAELCPECLRATEWRACIDCEGAGDESGEDCDLCEGNGGHNVCRCGWNDEK